MPRCLFYKLFCFNSTNKIKTKQFDQVLSESINNSFKKYINSLTI